LGNREKAEPTDACMRGETKEAQEGAVIASNPTWLFIIADNSFLRNSEKAASDHNLL
jgi:hypothetical protein